MTSRKVTPLGDTVLIGPMKRPTHSAGGIVLLEGSLYDGDQKQWVVLAVGPKCSAEILVGDRVLFNPQLPDGVKYVFEDGSRWTLVASRRIEMVW